MTTKSKPKKDSESLNDNGRLIPPENGVTVRMYRIGHGDCFLLAFAGEKKDKPVYLLIDCGYKPGSGDWPDFYTPPPEKKDGEEGKPTPDKKIRSDLVAKNIFEATGGHIDVAVITHEHQDHVNGITKTRFGEIEIGETWLAWTEDPDDDVAKSLRTEFKDHLMGLVAARNRLAAEGSPEELKHIDRFLEFELGWDSESGDPPSAEALLAADEDGGGSKNKTSMKVFKDRSRAMKYVKPHEDILKIPGAKDLRIFALGPPYDAGKLKDLDPEGGEAFEKKKPDKPKERTDKIAMSPRDYFMAALDKGRQASNLPFARQYSIPLDKTVSEETPREFIEFFLNHYGVSFDEAADQDVHPEFAEFIKEQYVESLKDSIKQRGGGSVNPENPDNADWRRIDHDWLYSTRLFALAMNSYTNNTSLVLAFELGKGGKVLLFAGDAQRGNWVSWDDKDWKGEDGSTITTRDLLKRTVLYKVGHHGSHNATLNGEANSAHPSLGWMAATKGDKFAKEFTAMITAVNEWAVKEAKWNHPLPDIKEALLDKTSGRVFQTDTDFDKMRMKGGKPADWNSFKSRTSVDKDRLYFDYTITR